MTQVAERILEDHFFEKEGPLVVQLRIPDDPTFDSLYQCERGDVSASVVFYFEDNDDEEEANYQFNANTGPEDAMNFLDGPCSICCHSGEDSNFDCVVWFRSSDLTKIKYLCEDCLGSFLEIRDGLLEEFSGQIASNEL